MRILFLTDNFVPEVNAPATRTYEHCIEWVKLGADVTVITCVPNFPKGKVFDGYKNKWRQTEYIDGIKVVRVWSFIAANKGFLKRTIDFLSFSISAFLAGLFIKTDIIIATSPQFFTALSGKALGFVKRKPWVMEVRDLWPESIKTVGAMKDNLIIRYFEYLEKKCYKSAKIIITVTDSFKAEISNKGIDPQKIHVIKNGANLELFKPIKKDQGLIEKMGIENKIILGYIGTHGMAHKLDFLLDCAKELEETNYHFLFIGSGAEKENLLKKQKVERINNVTMLDGVPKKEVIKYLSILDVALINLKKDDLFKTVIPSKIFENAAMQIPILIGVEGEARKLVEKFGAGIFYEPENREHFIYSLNQIMDNNTVKKMKFGCKKMAFTYDRKKMAEILFSVLKESI